MKNTAEYRIKEHMGVFTIQIRAYKTKGMLWWRKKEWGWYSVNAWGGVLQSYPILQPICRNFKTLKDAEKRIQEWENEPKYHYFIN